jgi:AcrR family transcriptional regulator
MSTFQCSLEEGRREEQQVSCCAIPDKSMDLVRYLPVWFGVKVMLQEKRAKDRRIQKTKNLLHEALGSLIREKPYEAIVVQEILDRANVGRSTFYTHFRDKDELLISGIRDILSVLARELPYTGKQYERIIGFSLPIFEHIHRHLRTGGRKMGIRGRAVIHGQLQKILEELIANDVKKDFQNRRRVSGRIPADLLVQYVASTFVLVLNWWVDSRDPLLPDEIDGLFRSLVLPTMAATFE